MPDPTTLRRPATVSNRVQALRPGSRPAAPPARPVSSRVAVAGFRRPAAAPARPISQRVRAVQPPPGQRVVRAGVIAAKATGEFSLGVVDGLGNSVKSTWGFISHDAWQVKTWTEMGTTIVAISLASSQAGGMANGRANAQWLDQHLGTHFAPRQVQLVMALDQTFKEMPHWQSRQWGQLTGRIIGDVLTTKGAAMAPKAAIVGTSTLNKVAATRYLAKSAAYAEAFSEVKGFSIGVGQRSYKVQEALQWAQKGRWLSNQKLASSSETVVKMALDYPGSRNLASRRWSARRFGIYIEGTVAPQANPLGGGGHQLFRVAGKEAFYVEVPYK